MSGVPYVGGGGEKEGPRDRRARERLLVTTVPRSGVWEQEGEVEGRVGLGVGPCV